MPVDQEFTCRAGNEVMGFPKTVMGIEANYTDDTAVDATVFDERTAPSQMFIRRVASATEADALPASGA